MRMAHMFEILDPSWWHHLGRIRRCALAGGGVSMGVGSELTKIPGHSQLLCLLPVSQDVNSQLPLQHQACYEGHGV